MSICSANAALARRRKSQAGLTLVELIVAFTILTVLASMALPMARYQVRRLCVCLLLRDLDEMRAAIDKYKDMCDTNKIQSSGPDAYCYPPSFEILVEGVKLNNTITTGKDTGKVRFLRRFPKDPMTGEKDWGKRSMQDEPETDSWGGQNVFDVYSKTIDKASDGTPYSEW